MPDGHDIIRIRKLRKGSRYAGDYRIEWLRDGERKPVRLITVDDLEFAHAYILGFVVDHPNTRLES